MSKVREWSIGILTLLLVIGGYVWNEYREAKELHMMQTAEDIAFENILKSELQKGSVELTRVIPGNWDKVCIVPSYGNIDQMKLNDEAKEKLSFLNENSRLFMKFQNKTTDQVWWLFTLSSGLPDFTYRGSFELRLGNKEKCFDRKEAIFYKKKGNANLKTNAIYATDEISSQK